MCTDVAANVLGLDPDDKEAKQRGTDAIKELLNVTCGHILTMVAGERAVFDVGVPKVSVLKQGDWEILLSFPETLGFRIDDKPVLMRLVLHP
jgi:hypothetical protein